MRRAVGIVQQPFFADIFSNGVSCLLLEKMHEIGWVKIESFCDFANRKIRTDIFIDIFHYLAYFFVGS